MAGLMTFGCEVIYGEGDKRAEAMQRLVEESTGEPCPCSQGRECPLLGLRVEPVPRAEVA